MPSLAPPAAPAPPPAPRGAGGGEASGWRPPGWAPPLAAVTYVKESATTLLLVLALPYVFFKLLTAPGHLLKSLGRHHAAPAT